MPRYVDGFVLPVPRRKVAAYRRLARRAGRIWKEHGALEYRECIGDDLDIAKVKTFPRQMRLKKGETVFFSWIVYKSRAHRDRVNRQVMKDPRILAMMTGPSPCDLRRMVYGGFRIVVDS
jgi:uncharacterized protein YbaA (DUF1428 family)